MSRSVQNYTSNAPFGREQSRDLPAVRVIPYDYIAQFELRGEPGNLIQDVINVSVEGVFVAVSIGYGIQERRAAPFNVLATNGDSSINTLGDITLGEIPPDVLIEGLRIAPEFESIAIKNDRLNDTLPFSLASTIFERLRSPQNVTFLLSIVDSATGRELQNEPVHSVATLGDANGRRPFRALSQPMVFMPRSTVRLQIEERTKDATGTLFITLQGYKVLGVAGTDEEEVRRLIHLDPLRRIPVYEYETGNYRALGEAILRDVPTTGLVPFDYVSTLDLTGKPDRIVEDEIPVNIDGGYVALAIGYSLDPGDVGIEVDRSDDLVPLNEIKLTEFRPAQALLDGIRIDPVRLRLAFTSGGLSVLPRDTVQRMFQRLNPSEDVRFLYSIIDSGTGRELQNRPVDNIAGMGTASGERPFRILHKPMMFLPRSTIRVQVKEISGRGRLFIVFQGYKMLT